MFRKDRLPASFVLFAFLLASRLCHLRVVWTEEAYPAAAAIQMLHGKALYRDVWFDKPPLSAAAYLLWDARNGWALRLAGAIFLWLCAMAAWRFAEGLWGRREGVAAAWLLAFFCVFDFPASTIVLGPDLLMLLPHLMAVWLAWRGKAFWSGVAAGIAFLCNAKGVFVLAACLAFCPAAWLAMLAGFALPCLAAAGWLAGEGALAAYWQQVWEWGLVYARDTPLAHPWLAGALRTLSWCGFHAALVAGCAVYFVCDRRNTRRWLPFAIWIAVSLAAVAEGWRFFPRYYFQLLPAAAILAARGFTLAGKYRIPALAVLLMIPLIRFGPRYATLAGDLVRGRQPQWTDLRMSEDAADAAQTIERLARPGDTLLVWGYRPEIFARTRMAAGTRFLDSQPLTGVIADRHLTSSHVSFPALAQKSRAALIRTQPDFIVDGLGPYNPALAIGNYPDLLGWLAEYREIGRTQGCVIYERKQR